MQTIESGETVILVDENDRRIRVRVKDTTRKVKGLGVVNLGNIIGRGPGDRLRMAGREVVVLRPAVIDHMETLERRAQIIMPKDAAHLILHCGIGPGSRVVEGGSGSGSLTLALAGAVSPDGEVISYDNRPEHQAVARRNVDRAGLSGVVTWKEADVSEGIPEREVDAVILDVPDPWTSVVHAGMALVPGGRFGAYIPTTNQAERTVRAMRSGGLIMVGAVEVLLREMEVSKRGIRPAFDMLGHTGYMCIGIWPGTAPPDNK